MIVIVAGIAGSGKTTVGERLARRMGCEFADGDRFHSPAAVAKMHDGVPLTDDDRWPWLDAIGAWIDQEDAAGKSAVVVSGTCLSSRKVCRRASSQRPALASASTYQNVHSENVPSWPCSPSGDALGLYR